MELKVGINSYVTLEEANKIVEDYILSDYEEYLTWKDLSDDDKIKVVIRGTRGIDTLPFIGRRDIHKISSMKFPRVINNKEVIPDEVKIASVINGIRLYILGKDSRYQAQRQGVKSISIGKNSESYDLSMFNSNVTCEALEYIEKYVCRGVRT